MQRIINFDNYYILCTGIVGGALVPLIVGYLAELIGLQWAMVTLILPLSIADELKIEDKIKDRRKATLEDVFIYYFTQDEQDE